jgi:hypothetical protein
MHRLQSSYDDFNTPFILIAMSRPQRKNPNPQSKTQIKKRKQQAKAEQMADWSMIPTTRVKQPKGFGSKNQNKPKRGQLEKTYGEQLGGLLGRGAQTLATRIFGSGDYSVKKNSLVLGNLPEFNKSRGSKGGVMVAHREYLGDVTASESFNLNAYNLNPGLSTTFPWLSQMAVAFEEYIIHGLIVEFVSESSDSVLSTAANSALGVVMMAITYDSLDPNFPNKKEMLNYEFAQSRKPSTSFLLPMECSRAETPFHELFVRTTSAPSGSDIRLYDAGVLQIATQGQQANSGTLGELWITYDIEFLKPKFIVSEVGQLVLADHWSAGSGPTNAAPLTGMIVTGSSTLGLSLTTGNTLTFPNTISSGQWLAIGWWKGATPTALTNEITVSFVNATAGPDIWLNATKNLVDNYATTTSMYLQMFTFTITAATASFTLSSGGTLPTSVTDADFTVTQLPVSPWELKQQVSKLQKKCLSPVNLEDNERYSNWKLSHSEYAELKAYREKHEARSDLDQDHMNDVRERELLLTQQRAAYKKNELIAKIREQQLETARLLNKMDDFPMDDADYRDTWEYLEGSEDHKETIDRLKFDPVKKGTSNEAQPLPTLTRQQIESGQYRYYTPRTLECKICGMGMKPKPRYIMEHYQEYHPGQAPDILMDDIQFCKVEGCSYGTKNKGQMDHHYKRGTHSSIKPQKVKPFIRPQLSRPPSEKIIEKGDSPIGEYDDTPPASPDSDGIIRLT